MLSLRLELARVPAFLSRSPDGGAWSQNQMRRVACAPSPVLSLGLARTPAPIARPRRLLSSGPIPTAEAVQAPTASPASPGAARGCSGAARKRVRAGARGALKTMVRRVEQNLARVEREVQKNRLAIRAVGDDGREARRLWKPDTVESLHNKVLRLEELLRGAVSFTSSLNVKGYQVFSPLAVATLLTLLGLGYAARRDIYSRVAEESAELGKEMLQQNRRNLVTTIDQISKDPETLAALQVQNDSPLPSSTTPFFCLCVCVRARARV